MLGAQKPRIRPRDAQRPLAFDSGSPFSLGDLPEHVVVQFLLGQEALESCVLFLESLESRHVVGSHGGILAAPTLIGLV